MPPVPGTARRTLSSVLTGFDNPMKTFTSGSLLGRFAKGGFALGALDFANQSMLSPLASALRESLTGNEQRDARNRLMMEHQLQTQLRAVQAEQAQKQQFIQMNMQRVASFAPDIAQRVLAGRRLTQGGVAIGGQPRTDLLTELASHMSDGSLQ